MACTVMLATRLPVLRAILNAAVQSDRIVRSPCRGVKLPATQHEERHIVMSDELAALATSIGDDDAPMVFLGAVLGLRWGECAGLRVGRLDFLRSTLAVAEQVTRGPKGATVLGPPKSAAGRRTLSVPTPLMDMLAAHLARRGLTGAHSDAFVFTAPNGGPLDYSHFRRRAWLPACAAPNSRTSRSMTCGARTRLRWLPKAWTSRPRRTASVTLTRV
jgi:integrase